MAAHWKGAPCSCWHVEQLSAMSRECQKRQRSTTRSTRLAADANTHWQYLA